jgi:glycosyltransferase involved in cell wall biosynthesis
MRVLHLCNHCDEVGNGIMNVAVDLACSQRELRHDVAFASGGGSYVRLLEDHGVRHALIRQEWKKPQRLPITLFHLRRLVIEFRPEIIHAHMMTGAILGRAIRLLPGGGQARVVTTVHNEWQKSAVVMGLGDRVIAVSRAVAERMEQRGIPARKMSVVRNGPLASPRRPLSETRPASILGKPAVVTVGGLYERKGIRDLIAAFASLAQGNPDATLTIVGDGPDAAVFKQLAAATPCAARIHFAGFQADPRPWLAAADIFVLASRNEPFGLVLAEAREAGIAIVATDVGGIPEVLDGGEAGVLVPPQNPSALAAALQRLIDDPQERALWAGRAQSNLDWLSVRRMAEETIQTYAAAIDDGRSRYAVTEQARNAG